MFVRLTFINFSPEEKDAVKRIFNEEIVPVLRKQKGLKNVRLLEPANSQDDYISMTEWESKADADAYENSGTYKELLEKVKDKLTKKAELKTYTVETVGSMSRA